MSRPIKFRAWDINDHMMYQVAELVMSDLGIDWNAKGDHAIQGWRGKAKFMQFTGLTDKNGVEIYEGDILAKTYPTIPAHTQEHIDKMKAEIPGVMLGLSGIPHDEFPERTNYIEVRWDEDNAQWSIPRDYDGDPDLDGWQVAGNIYENPDLLPTPPVQKEGTK